MLTLLNHIWPHIWPVLRHHPILACLKITYITRHQSFGILHDPVFQYKLITESTILTAICNCDKLQFFLLYSMIFFHISERFFYLMYELNLFRDYVFIQKTMSQFWNYYFISIGIILNWCAISSLSIESSLKAFDHFSLRIIEKQCLEVICAPLLSSPFCDKEL